MSRILVTGASGLLGLNFALQANSSNEITGVVNHHTLSGAPFPVIQKDLAKPGSVEDLLDEINPDVVLHCAAMANIDQCENQPDLAMKVNAQVPGEFAKETQKRDIKLVYISTDAVFDGQQGNYHEKDIPNPLSVYARTKLEGERSVQADNADALIARVNFFGWSLNGQRSLSEFFFNNLKAGKPMMGFTDVFFCPLMVNDLVDVLLEMIQLDLSGIYHTLSSQCMSKYSFGCAIADQFGYDRELIKPITVSKSNLKAARSPNLTLATQKLITALGHNPPDIHQGIERLYLLFKNGFSEKIQSFASNQ